MTFWLCTEERALAETYPVASREEICAAIPNHSWPAIVSRASILQIKRQRETASHPIMTTLTERRKMLGLSQVELAAKTGISRFTIHRGETGQILPSVKTLDLWCRGLSLKLTVARLPE